MTEIEQAYKNYEIVLSTETCYDIDELGCILQQFEAIMMGWGMDFTVEIVEEPEDQVKIWTRERSNPCLEG